MKATIIGGGITGLTLANILQQFGIDYAIFEAAPQFRPVGAGIILSPNALYIFDRLGLYHDLSAAGHPLRRFDIANANGRVIQKNETSFQQHGKPYHAIGIHRSELQRILLEQLPSKRIHLGKQLKRLDLQTNQLNFTDETAVQAAYVLGCDGIHSKVRQALFPNATLRYSGQTCWRGIVNSVPVQGIDQNPAELWGNGLRFGYVPIAKDRIYWYATAVRPPQKETVQPTHTANDLAILYQQFAPFVSRLIASTSDSQIMRHDLYDLMPLQTWSKGNCLLLGDAAHAMTPNMGQGAAQGIEDAWAFGNSLANTDTAQDAFQTFVQDRFAKANLVAKRSWQIGQITNLKNTLLCHVRNALMGSLPESVANRSKTQLFSVPSYEVMS